MELHWTANLNLAACHAAWCYARFPQRITRPHAALQQSSAALDSLPPDWHLPAERVWEELLVLAAHADSSVELARRLQSRLSLSGTVQQSRLAALLQANRQAFDTAYPGYQTEAALRAAPLQQQWEARGPGLLRYIGRLTEAELIVERAEIVMVQPVVGGLGYAHLSANRVHLEALLTDADAALPEVLRLAWLLAQLDFDRPVYSELIHAHRLRVLAGLAMLPAVLAAGQELELCHNSAGLLERAIEVWHLAPMAASPAAAAEVIDSWWQTYQAARPEWRIALTGLDQMMA